VFIYLDSADVGYDKTGLLRSRSLTNQN